MYEKNSAIRLVIYSVAGVACGVLMLLGVITADQSDTIMNAVGPAIGTLIAMLAAFNVNRSDSADNAPTASPAEDGPGATVGAFQIRE